MCDPAISPVSEDRTTPLQRAPGPMQIALLISPPTSPVPPLEGLCLRKARCLEQLYSLMSVRRGPREELCGWQFGPHRSPSGRAAAPLEDEVHLAGDVDSIWWLFCWCSWPCGRRGGEEAAVRWAVAQLLAEDLYPRCTGSCWRGG